MWRTVVLFLCLLVVLSENTRTAPKVQDKGKDQAVNLDAHLTYTLKNSPLANREKEQIYRVVGDAVLNGAFDKKDMQEQIWNTRLGFISLAENGSQQMVMVGPELLCGATRNCPIWIFVHQHEQWQLALGTWSNSLLIKKHVSDGLHDIETYLHASATEGTVDVYRWDGKRYQILNSHNWDATARQLKANNHPR